MRKCIAIFLAAVLLLTAGCSKSEDNSAQLKALQEENASLREQVAQLQQQIATLEAGSIADWSLTGEPLIHGSGALVTLTVTPTSYVEGQMISFRVQLEGQMIASMYCDWDGSVYTASVELDAADGYSYSILLTEPNGTQEYRELNSPANPVDSTLVYMYSSMAASCFLTVSDWQMEDNTMTILGSSVDVQLPLFSPQGEPISCTGINLILQLDGVDLDRKSIMVPQSADSYLSIPLSPADFAMPEMEESNQLDLWLEVTLSDGQVLRHCGSSWFLFEGQLIQAVG